MSAEDMAKFDLEWTGDKPDEQCPSCNGTGWATIFAGHVAVAGGRCRCRGGLTWSIPPVLSGQRTDTGDGA